MTLPLITLVLLPFAGSLIAALLPANARNAESTLAGAIALIKQCYERPLMEIFE